MSRRYVFTAKRRAALRKAQLVSARKRKSMSPKTKRRVKKGAFIAAGAVGATLLAREVKVSNTYIYAMKRYNTLANYRTSPNMEYERRHMKHRQRSASFGRGRSTFAIRKKRQDYQRNITKQRIIKM